MYKKYGKKYVHIKDIIVSKARLSLLFEHRLLYRVSIGV